MALTQVQTAGTNASATTCVQAFGSNNAAGNLIIVTGQTSDITTTLTCTDTQGNAYIQRLLKRGSTNSSFIFDCLSCKAGANTVTITASSSTFIEIVITEANDSATGLVWAFDQAIGGAATNASMTTGATATLANAASFAYAYGESSTITGGTGGSWTTTGTSTGTKKEYLVTAATTALTATFTQSGSAAWVCVIGVWYRATVAQVQPFKSVHSTAVSGTPMTNAFSSPISLGNTLFVQISSKTATGAVTSVKDSLGNPYVLINSQQAGTTSWMFYCPAATFAGANTVSVTVNAAINVEITISEFNFGSGNQAGFLTQQGNTGSGTSMSSGGVTTTTANALLIGMVTGANTASAGEGGWTSTITGGGNVVEFILVSSNQTNVSATGTQPTGAWSGAVAAFSIQPIPAPYYIAASGAVGTGDGSSAGNAADASTNAKLVAIILAKNAWGQVINYAAGTYLSLRNLQIFNGVTHNGAGIGSTIIQGAPTSQTYGALYWNAFNGGAGTLRTVTAFSVQNMTLDLNTSNQTWWNPASGTGTVSGVNLPDGAQKCLIQNCKLINIGAQNGESFPVAFGDGLGNSNVQLTVSGNIVNNCTFTQPILTGNTNGGMTCVICVNSQAGIGVDATNIVQNCTFTNLYGGGFSDITYAQAVSGPVVQNCTATGLSCFWYFEPGDYSGQILLPGIALSCTGNTVSNVGQLMNINFVSTGVATFAASGTILVQANTITLTPGNPVGVQIGSNFTGTDTVGAVTVNNNIFNAIGSTSPIAVKFVSVTPKFCTVLSSTITNNIFENFPAAYSLASAMVTTGESSVTETSNIFATGPKATGVSLSVGAVTARLITRPSTVGTAGSVGVLAGATSRLITRPAPAGTAHSTGAVTARLITRPMPAGTAATLGVLTERPSTRQTPIGTASVIGAVTAELRSRPATTGTASSVGAVTARLITRPVPTGTASAIGSLTARPATRQVIIQSGALSIGLVFDRLITRPASSGSAAATGAVTIRLICRPSASGTASSAGVAADKIIARPSATALAQSIGVLTARPATRQTPTGSGSAIGTVGPRSATRQSATGSSISSSSATDRLTARINSSGTTSSVGAVIDRTVSRPGATGTAGSLGVVTVRLIARPAAIGGAGSIGVSNAESGIYRTAAIGGAVAIGLVTLNREIRQLSPGASRSSGAVTARTILRTTAAGIAHSFGSTSVGFVTPKATAACSSHGSAAPRLNPVHAISNFGSSKATGVVVARLVVRPVPRGFAFPTIGFVNPRPDAASPTAKTVVNVSGSVNARVVYRTAIPGTSRSGGSFVQRLVFQPMPAGLSRSFGTVTVRLISGLIPPATSISVGSVTPRKVARPKAISTVQPITSVMPELIAREVCLGSAVISGVATPELRCMPGAPGASVSSGQVNPKLIHATHTGSALSLGSVTTRLSIRRAWAGVEISRGAVTARLTIHSMPAGGASSSGSVTPRLICRAPSVGVSGSIGTVTSRVHQRTLASGKSSVSSSVVVRLAVRETASGASQSSGSTTTNTLQIELPNATGSVQSAGSVVPRLMCYPTATGSAKSIGNASPEPFEEPFAQAGAFATGLVSIHLACRAPAIASAESSGAVVKILEATDKVPGFPRPGMRMKVVVNQRFGSVSDTVNDN